VHLLLTARVRTPLAKTHKSQQHSTRNRLLCDRLVVDAADEPGVLPHVQETLRLL